MESISFEDFKKYSIVISINDRRLVEFKKRFKNENIVFNEIKKCGIQYSDKTFKQIFNHYSNNYNKKELIESTKINCDIYSEDIIISEIAKYYLHTYYCGLSHLNAIRYAFQNNWPFVTIFEDDVIPCNDVLKKLQFFLNEIPSDWEILKFEDSSFKILKLFNHYGYKYYPAKYIPFSVIKQQPFICDDRPYNAGGGCGCYVVNSTIFKKFIEDAEKQMETNDMFVNDIEIYKYNLYYSTDLLFAQPTSLMLFQRLYDPNFITKPLYTNNIQMKALLDYNAFVYSDNITEQEIDTFSTQFRKSTFATNKLIKVNKDQNDEYNYKQKIFDVIYNSFKNKYPWNFIIVLDKKIYKFGNFYNSSLKLSEYIPDDWEVIKLEETDESLVNEISNYNNYYVPYKYIKDKKSKDAKYEAFIINSLAYEKILNSILHNKKDINFIYDALNELNVYYCKDLPLSK